MRTQVGAEVDPTIDKDMLKWVRLAHVPFVFIALHLLGGANAVWGFMGVTCGRNPGDLSWGAKNSGFNTMRSQKDRLLT